MFNQRPERTGEVSQGSLDKNYIRKLGENFRFSIPFFKRLDLRDFNFKNQLPFIVSVCKLKIKPDFKKCALIGQTLKTGLISMH